MTHSGFVLDILPALNSARIWSSHFANREYFYQRTQYSSIESEDETELTGGRGITLLLAPSSEEELG